MPAARSEVRYHNDAVDEVIATKVDVHIEQLDIGVWWICLTHPDGSEDHVTLRTARNAKITAIFHGGL